MKPSHIADFYLKYMSVYILLLNSASLPRMCRYICTHPVRCRPGQASFFTLISQAILQSMVYFISIPWGQGAEVSIRIFLSRSLTLVLWVLSSFSWIFLFFSYKRKENGNPNICSSFSLFFCPWPKHMVCPSLSWLVKPPCLNSWVLIIVWLS